MAVGDLAKLRITPLPPSKMAKDLKLLGRDYFEVQFNPKSYSLSKSVTWNEKVGAEGEAVCDVQSRPRNRIIDAPELDFGGGGPRVLTLELFFDVTEGGPKADVRTQTNQLVRLTLLDRDLKNPQSPPICMLSWGDKPPPGSDLPMKCVVTSLRQDFVMFRASGLPVRANVNVTFTEFIDSVKNKKENDPDLTTYTVKRNDTLSAIAATLYRDASRWRVIAVANGIDDPRNLIAGTRLSIPRQT